MDSPSYELLLVPLQCQELHPEPLAVPPPQPLIILKIRMKSDTGPADHFLSYPNSLQHLQNAHFSSWGQAHQTLGAEFPINTWYCIGWIFCQVKIKPVFWFLVFFFFRCRIFGFCSLPGQQRSSVPAGTGKGQSCLWLSKAALNNWRSISWTAWAPGQNLIPWRNPHCIHFPHLQSSLDYLFSPFF